MQNKKSMYKNPLHSYTPTIKFQKKKWKKIPFAIATKRDKYLGINLTKDVKDLYTENYKHDEKRFKKTMTGIGRINIVKMSVLPRSIYDLMHSPSKSQWHFLYFTFLFISIKMFTYVAYLYESIKYN